ncbi:hypothetical protein D3C85_1714490 [compost metagenome]
MAGQHTLRIYEGQQPTLQHSRYKDFRHHHYAETFKRGLNRENRIIELQCRLKKR